MELRTAGLMVEPRAGMMASMMEPQLAFELVGGKEIETVVQMAVEMVDCWAYSRDSY